MERGVRGYNQRGSEVGWTGAHGRGRSRRLQESDFRDWLHGGRSPERGQRVSGLKEKTRSAGHSKSAGLEHQNGDISAGPRPGLRKRGGQQSAQGRRGRGTPSLAAGRASRPRPSRLHLPRRPQVTPSRWRVRGIPRGESGANPGLLSPRTARGSRGHRAAAAAAAAVTGSSLTETAWALTRDSTPLRRAVRMRKAKRVWRPNR